MPYSLNNKEILAKQSQYPILEMTSDIEIEDYNETYRWKYYHPGEVKTYLDKGGLVFRLGQDADKSIKEFALLAETAQVFNGSLQALTVELAPLIRQYRSYAYYTLNFQVSKSGLVSTSVVYTPIRIHYYNDPEDFVRAIFEVCIILYILYNTNIVII